MPTKRSLEYTKPKIVYNKSSNSWTKNEKPIEEGYKYYDTKAKLTRVFHNGQFVNENDYRFSNVKKDNIKRNIKRNIINSALALYPPTAPISLLSRAIDIITDIGTKYSGGSPIPDGTEYTGLHRFGNNKHTSLTHNRSTIISGKNARGNQAILNYYLYGDDSKLNKSTQEPIKIKNNSMSYLPNADYNFLPVDTITLTDDWKNTIDSLSKQDLQPIDNFYFVDDEDKRAIQIRNNPRYKDKTVYDYGRARAKVLKDNKGNYTLRTIDKFDTGNTVGPLGVVLETLKKTNPLIIRHDNPIKFIKAKDANHFNQDNDLLYNLMFRE